MLAIKTSVKGKKYISPALGEKLLSLTGAEKTGNMSYELLSDRKFEVLRYQSDNKNVKEIAEIMSFPNIRHYNYPA